MKRLFNIKTLVFCGILATLSVVFYWTKPYQNTQPIQWDVSIYYAYLPATFIYNDVGIEMNWPVDLYGHQLYFSRPHNGKEALKMSMGMAYLYAPFFAAGHGYALFSESFKADGFSLPYHIAISFGAVVWTSVGLFFLWLFLSRFVSKSIAGLTVFLMIAATNLGYYTLWEGAMSHSAVFTLMAVLLEMSERYVQKQKLKYILFVGFLAGWVVLIRPIFAAHFLVLAGFYIYRLRGNVAWQHALVLVVCALLPWLPQLAYWKYITGDWLHYSYTQERFFWTDPKIWRGLFSWRKGWFVYTPFMLLIFPSFYFLFRKDKAWFALVLGIFALHIYIIFSWWCWWYGGSFGMRAMIGIYPLLAIPIAILLQRFFQLKYWLLKGAFIVVLLFTSAYNIFTEWQYAERIIHFDAMTKGSYKKIFLQLEQPDDFYGFINEADYEAAKRGERDQ